MNAVQRESERERSCPACGGESEVSNGVKKVRESEREREERKVCLNRAECGSVFV